MHLFFYATFSLISFKLLCYYSDWKKSATFPKLLGCTYFYMIFWENSNTFPGFSNMFECFFLHIDMFFQIFLLCHWRISPVLWPIIWESGFVRFLASSRLSVVPKVPKDPESEVSPQDSEQTLSPSSCHTLALQWFIHPGPSLTPLFRQIEPSRQALSVLFLFGFSTGQVSVPGA